MLEVRGVGVRRIQIELQYVHSVSPTISELPTATSRLEEHASLGKSVGASAESEDLCSTRALELTMIDRPINRVSRPTGSTAYKSLTLSNVDTLAVAGPGPYISRGCYIIKFQIV
jgi:hypothetical protein